MNDQIIRYTIEDRIKDAPNKIKELFCLLHPKISALTDVKSYANGNYIGYKLSVARSLFVEMHIQKERIVLHLRDVDYYTARLTICKKPNSHKWTLNKIVDLNSLKDLDAIIDLVKQSHYDIITIVNHRKA